MRTPRRLRPLGRVHAIIGVLSVWVALGLSVPPAGVAALRSHGVHETAAVTWHVRHEDDDIHIALRPDRAGIWNTIQLTLRSHSLPVDGAVVTMTTSMSAMDMTQTFRLAARPGVYSYDGPTLTMPGRWMFVFRIRPRGERPFTVRVIASIPS
jgi:hypothetical protein